MVLLTALLLSLVFLASLANILFRLPPKKLPALLRTLFAEHPPAAAASPAASGKSDGAAAVAATVLEQPRKEQRPDMSAERRTELRRVFATFDRNGDGHITREELRESLRGLRISVSDAEVEEAVTGSDANGDGRIDLDEFCGLLESMSAVEKAGGGGDGDGEAELKEAFDVFDRDGDGVITVEELGRVLSSLGMSEGKRAEACEEMIRKVDVDGDGMVNFDEFKRMMRGGQTLLVSAY
ncbi:probable calcium-binding protein CML17 [Syzygium oleosum]|uniref:probable calcium-binding protein CML17 n=1 Tax=Syzygium oleosum TaxID=219896 RepID=UPI0011D1E55B|nr:probable calcium-binding protein CML17 [Syzygium oleosum]